MHWFSLVKPPLLLVKPPLLLLQLVRPPLLALQLPVKPPLLALPPLLQPLELPLPLLLLLVLPPLQLVLPWGPGWGLRQQAGLRLWPGPGSSVPWPGQSLSPQPPGHSTHTHMSRTNRQSIRVQGFPLTPPQLYPPPACPLYVCCYPHVGHKQQAAGSPSSSPAQEQEPYPPVPARLPYAPAPRSAGTGRAVPGRGCTPRTTPP